MPRPLLVIMVGCVLLLLLASREGRGGEVEVILQDTAGGAGVGKAEFEGQRFTLKVASLAPRTEYTVTVLGSFAQGAAVLASFLTGTKGEAKVSIEVTSIDLALVEEVQIRGAEGGSETISLHGLAQ